MIKKQCCRTQSLKESEVRSENDSEEEETYLKSDHSRDHS